MAWRAIGTEGNWTRGHLILEGNCTEGIWFRRAFGRGLLEQRAFGFGGHLVRGHFFEGFWTEGIFLGGHLDLEGIWSEGIFWRAFGLRAFFWRATGTTSRPGMDRVTD